MNNEAEIMRTLGRIEGLLEELKKLNDRVAKLEQWQAWLKGAWAVMAAGLAWVVKKS